jgi:oxalate decarboxylase/phosphoglucose isomerase-like protein (cupin superfamily)
MDDRAKHGLILHKHLRHLHFTTTKETTMAKASAPNSFKFMSTKPQKFSGGNLYRASLSNFSALQGLAIQALDLEVGAIREPHVHPNAHQLDYCVSGRARVGIVGPEGRKQYLDLSEGDISFVPQGYLHWILSVGNRPLKFLVVLSHEEPETIELSEMVAGVPGATIEQLFGLPKDTFKGIPKGGLRIKNAP